MKKTMLRRIFTFCAASCMLTPVSAVFAETIDDAPAVTEITEEWETTTTTTTTCDPSMTDPVIPSTGRVFYGIVVLDEETAEPFSDLNVRLEKRYYVRDKDAPNAFPELAHMGVAFTGEIKVLDSWNTSDENPHFTQNFETEPDKPSYVFAVIEDLPEGYSWYGQETCLMYVYGTPEGMEPYPHNILLRKEKYFYYENFPVTGTYTYKVSLVDKVTDEIVPDLDCAVINTDTGEEVYRWNSTEEPVADVTLEYRFDDWKMKDAMHYIVKVYNMPDYYYLNYLTPSVPADYAPLLSYTVDMWEKGITERKWEFGLTSTDPPVTDDIYEFTTTTEECDHTTTTTTAELYFDTTTTTSETESVTTTTTTFSSNTTTTTTAAESVTTTTASDLPQTGNNSPVRILIVCGALLLISSGAWTFIIARRKENIS